MNMFNTHAQECLTELVFHLFTCSEILSDLLFAVNAGETGVVSPTIVSPNNLFKGLQKIKDNFRIFHLRWKTKIIYYIC